MKKKRAMDVLEIEYREDVIRSIAAVLHLGNICFEPTGDGCKVSTVEGKFATVI